MPKDLDQLNNLRVIFTVCIMPSCFASVSRFALCYTGLGCINVVILYSSSPLWHFEMASIKLR